MPYDIACNHKRCAGGLCKMLTPEEIEPSTDDIELGRRLVAEGWRSVSTKYRRVRRWVRVAPPLLEVLSPEWREHPVFKTAAKRVDYSRKYGLREDVEGSPDVETLELTIKEWRAFKHSGGQMG